MQLFHRQNHLQPHRMWWCPNGQVFQTNTYSELAAGKWESVMSPFWPRQWWNQCRAAGSCNINVTFCPFHLKVLRILRETLWCHFHEKISLILHFEIDGLLYLLICHSEYHTGATLSTLLPECCRHKGDLSGINQAVWTQFSLLLLQQVV